MTINLEVPSRFKLLVDQAHQVALGVFRPISRKYDRANIAGHSHPKELDMLAALVDGMNSSGEQGAGARGVRRTNGNGNEVQNGGNLATVLSVMEASWRSEERRVGKECSSPCRSRWSPYH